MPSGEKKYFTPLLLFWGSALSTAQTVILREFLCTVDGNELAIGISLFFWLGFNAVGALIWQRRKKAEASRFIYVIFAGLVSSLLSVVLLRYFRQISGIPPASGIGVGMTTISALLAFAPPALISGYSFPFICGVFPDVRPRERVGYVYAIESLGLVLGFLAVILLISVGAGHLVIIAVGYAISLLISLAIMGVFKARLKRLSTLAVAAIIVLLVLLHYLDRETIRVAFDGLKTGFVFRSHIETHYNRYIIAEREGETTLFSNNHFLKSTGDEYLYRLFAHLIMTVAKRNENVLLIGAASYDLSRHISEHHPVLIDYIEYDRELPKFVMKSTGMSVLTESEVNIITDDGRHYVRNAAREYDVVVLDVPDPINLQLNRFFTVEFFSEIGLILREDGILALALPSVASVPSDAKREYLRSVFGALKSTFRFVVPLQSEQTYVIASNSMFDIHLDELVQRFNSRSTPRCGFEPELFSLALLEDNNQRIAMMLAPPYQHINSDLSPYGFFSNMIVWEMSTSESGNSLLSNIRGVGFTKILVIILGIFLVAHVIKRYRGPSYTFLMFCQGFFAIAIELIIIYRFQIQYGTLYYFIAILFSVFMTGLGLGSYLAKFYRLKISYLFVGNILIGGMLLFEELPFYAYISALLCTGGLTGAIFQAISAISIEDVDSSVIRVASVLDYADSAGATLAALLTTIILLPSIGPILSAMSIGIVTLLLLLYSL